MLSSMAEFYVLRALTHVYVLSETKKETLLTRLLVWCGLYYTVGIVAEPMTWLIFFGVQKQLNTCKTQYTHRLDEKKAKKVTTSFFTIFIPTERPLQKY